MPELLRSKTKVYPDRFSGCNSGKPAACHFQCLCYSIRRCSLIYALWQKEQDGWYKSINGKKEQLTVEVNYKAGSKTFEPAAIIFQQRAAEVGVPVQLQGMEMSLLSTKLRGHEYEMFFRSLSGNPFVINFQPLLHTSFANAGGMNVTGFGTPESDSLLDAINAAESPEDKAKLLKRLQEILYDQAAFISMFYLKDRLAVHRRFDNVKVSGLKPNYDVSAFTLQE